MLGLCLVSSIWSGIILAAKLHWKQNIHWINILWFATSATGFVYFKGWLG